MAWVAVMMWAGVVLGMGWGGDGFGLGRSCAHLNCNGLQAAATKFYFEFENIPKRHQPNSGNPGQKIEIPSQHVVYKSNVLHTRKHAHTHAQPLEPLEHAVKFCGGVVEGLQGAC